MVDVDLTVSPGDKQRAKKRHVSATELPQPEM